MNSIEDVPNDLMRAIQHANTICEWRENLDEDEMPPVWMWTFDEELDYWLERVLQDRKDKFKNPSSDDDEPSSPMMTNEYARGRR